MIDVRTQLESVNKLVYEAKQAHTEDKYGELANYTILLVNAVEKLFDAPIPCDVKVAPAMTFKQGVPLKMVLAAIARRTEFPEAARGFEDSRAPLPINPIHVADPS